MKRTAMMILVAGSMLAFGSCKKKGCTDMNANNYNQEAEKDDESCTYPVINTAGNGSSGDVNGAGGTASSSVQFTNNNATVGWDMAQSATEGSFTLTILDADGTSVMSNTLTAGSGAQDASGTSSQGTTGTWTANVTLTNFNGTGDYSFQ
ncbi:MAG: hypothetical protein ABJG68_11980 [Crocinitomicaceae bacterium]